MKAPYIHSSSLVLPSTALFNIFLVSSMEEALHELVPMLDNNNLNSKH